MRTRRMIASSMLGLLLVAGCSSDEKGVRPVVRNLSSEQSAEVSAANAKFEKSTDPEINADTHFAAGQLAESQRSTGTAIDQYRKALKIDPAHRGSWYRLGVLYAQMQAYPQAIEAWEKYLEISDGDATACSNLAFCQELAGHAEAAEQTYREGVAKDPKNAPCRVNYGLMLARTGRINEAIIQFQAVLTEGQVHYNLASVYEQQGKKELAKAEYRKAVASEPELLEAKARLAALD